MKGAEIAIVMAGEDELVVMQEAAQVLDTFGVPYEIEILSFHKDPEVVATYAKNIAVHQIKVVIAGASGAAHLPGVLAAYTTAPVIGVPIKAPNSIDGLDAIYSMLQTPTGIPVAVMALNNAKNAAIFALQILASKHPSYQELINAYKIKLKLEAERTNKRFKEAGYETFLKEIR